jgi:hypothetical protein
VRLTAKPLQCGTASALSLTEFVKFDHLSFFSLTRSIACACVRANTSTGTRAAVNGLYCRQELAMTQWRVLYAPYSRSSLRGALIDR